MRFRFALLFILCCLFTGTAFGQTAPGKYWIQFTDKNNSPYQLSDPHSFLSPAAVAKRQRLGISIDESDIPVNQNYIDQVLDICDCPLHNRSKWFNAVTIETDSTEAIALISELPFVSNVRGVRASVTYSELTSDKNEETSDKTFDMPPNESYGPSFHQINSINGISLHALGYTGKGIRVAVFDAGWTMADRLPAFDYLRSHNGIAETKDFVSPGNTDVYNGSTHGMYVLSIMAGMIADSLQGTAPDATYYLFRTEDPSSEYIVEEDNWVAAAEYADSTGIDIINSSLGYSLFEDTSQNHTYADMDGNTTRVTIGADIAASKGILVVNSAGNSGASAWRYITAPGDGDSVMCVGAINADSLRASFSSFGPSAGGAVKPNVCAIGFETVIADLDSTIRVGNGTSFSSPVIAGMNACLMQAFPDKRPMEIFRAVEQSSNQYSTPDDALGYGIPDYWKAFTLLRGNSDPVSIGSLSASIFPNPCYDRISVVIDNSGRNDVTYEIYDAFGKRIFESQRAIVSNNKTYLVIESPLERLSPGVYFLHLKSVYDHAILKFIKQNN